MTVFMCVLLLAGMAGKWVWKRLKARRADRDEMEQLLRETFNAEPMGDPVAAHFEEARHSLMELIPATPLCPPAVGRWKAIEADLAHDPEFMLPVLDALRERPQT